MGKVAIILGSNIHFAPYYFKYEKMLLERNTPFDLIMWDREHLHETTNADKIYRFTLKDEGNNGHIFKVYKFFLFSNFVRNVIKSQKYTKIIFLGLSGCAPTLGAHYYSAKYKKAYWLDIRDRHYEWLKPYYWLEKQAIENSFCTAISSRRFETFLPKWNYTLVHNIDSNMESIVSNLNKTNSKEIRISFIGHIRYFEENIELINQLANDGRFVLQYFGPGSEKLISYCKKCGIKNVIFVNQRFNVNETIDFYSKTDVINNVYGNRRIETKAALSNKLYYSVYLHMPIIVSPRTYMEEISTAWGIGISFIPEERFADKLYDFYKGIILMKNGTLFQSAKKTIEKDESVFQKQFSLFLEQRV